MNILAFDTCFDACSAAVHLARPGTAGSIRAEQQLMTTGHAEALMPMIARVMGEAGLTFAEVERIAVTTGPGTFTGTRICVSAARALALTLRVPVVGFSSLWAIAAFASARIPDCSGTHDAVLVARDARRDELYVEAVGIDGRSLTGPLLVSAVSAAALCPGYRLFAVGSGAEAVAEAGRRAGRQITARLDGLFEPGMLEPNAGFLASRAERAEPLREPPTPLYLRPPDAKPPVSASIPRAGGSGAR